MYKHALLALLLAAIVGCGTTSTTEQTEAKPKQAPSDTIGFAWSDGDRLQVEKVAHHITSRGEFEVRCDFTLAARRDGEQLVVEQQDLLPSPLPSLTAHRPFDRLYERFLCVLPSMRISADGRLLGVTGAQALAAKIQPAVLAYYRAHPERFEAGLGERVATQFAAPMLEHQATTFWGAIAGEWVGTSTEQLQAAAAADSEEETTTAVQHTVCPGAPRGGEQCIAIRYENREDRRDLVDTYSGPNEQAESVISTVEGRIVLQRATGYPVEWQEDITTTIEVRRLADGQKYAMEGLVRRKYTFDLTGRANSRAK